MAGSRKDRPVLRVYPDPESLSRAAAELFLELAEAAVAARGRFSVALSGGSTPRRTYELLSRPPFRDRAPWDRVYAFWGDERCVPADDPRRNALLAHRALLDAVPLPPEQIYPILCHPQPEEAAARYEALLKSFFAGGPPRFDLIFLGLGENGHTASIFPYTPVLKEAKRWVAAVYVAEEDLYRVTLTPVLLNQARHAAFLVAGKAKAGVLKEVLNGPFDPLRLPAQLIRPEGEKPLWLLDQEAASELGKG